MFLSIFRVMVFVSLLSRTWSFYIQRKEDGDILTGKLDYCSGSTFCQCINGTFLDYVSAISCGNKIAGCSLLVEGNSIGIYTVSGMSSYNLTLITGTDEAVCFSEPTPAPVFVQDYQNGMIWNPSFTDQLQNKFYVSIKDFSKVELKIANHLEGLFLKIFIDCDNKQQCVAIKFEGLQEYPLDPESFADIVDPTTTLFPETTTTKPIDSTTFQTSIETTSAENNKTLAATTTMPATSILEQNNKTLATTATMPTTPILEQNKTKIPFRNDAIILKKNLLAEIVIGVAVFLLLLVFFLICVLFYKRRRRKSIFKVSDNIPVEIQNNLASIIRMESNSLSTTPSKMNNMKINSMHDDSYKQPLQKSEKMMAESTIPEILQQSHIDPIFNPSVSERKRSRRVSFSSPPEQLRHVTHTGISARRPSNNVSKNEHIQSAFNENIEYEEQIFHYNN